MDAKIGIEMFSVKAPHFQPNASLTLIRLDRLRPCSAALSVPRITEITCSFPP